MGAVVALDAYPVRPVAWERVRVVDDARQVQSFGIDENGAPGIDRWALLLSWPPHSPETVGIDLLRSWPGQLLVYVGERKVQDMEELKDSGLTGGQELLLELERSWEP